MKKISEIKGIKIPLSRSAHFKEFVVDFNTTGKTVKEVNKALLEQGIFGGKDISTEFPQPGNRALYCVTEIHMKEDIDKLVQALSEFLD